ncbi:hypothetical protein [Spiroplasma endosymbiont of Polydrusus formosus]|uniref:hypothetical protein n=1 Tax=Spiroplasma endosymbiont of Polydrusus formosus TaxID=3139326 RepID=UPI0035B51ABC
MLAINDNLLISQTIFIIILICLAIIFCYYVIIADRKVDISAKKFEINLIILLRT